MKVNSNGQWSLQKCDDEKDGILFPLEKKTEASMLGDPIAHMTFEQLAKAIIADVPKQPTNEELFGHLVVPEEVMRKVEEQWENPFRHHADWVNHRLEEDKGVESFAKGKSFNEQFLEDGMSEEELAERAAHYGE